jgi:hypothetical protein
MIKILLKTEYGKYLIDVYERLHDFAEKRSDIMWNLLKDEYNLGDSVQVTLNVNDSDKGTITLSNFNPFEWSYPYSGNYYSNVPMTMTAIPNDGYKFLKWDGIDSESSSITIMPTENKKITAIFE